MFRRVAAAGLEHGRHEYEAGALTNRLRRRDGGESITLTCLANSQVRILQILTSYVTCVWEHETS